MNVQVGDIIKLENNNFVTVSTVSLHPAHSYSLLLLLSLASKWVSNDNCLRDLQCAETTNSIAVPCPLTMWTHAKSVCLCSGRSTATVEQRAAQPNVHRDSWTGWVSKAGPWVQSLLPVQGQIFSGDPRCCNLTCNSFCCKSFLIHRINFG